VDFDERLDAGTVVSRDGNTLGFFPSVLANAGLRLTWNGALLCADARYAGEMFLDNGEDATGRIAPRTVLDLTAGYRRALGNGAEASLRVRLFNALDRRYETGGYFDYDEAGSYVAHFVPAATRNAMVQLEVKF
jgi:outer membrane receptor protein involved in Fe transport